MDGGVRILLVDADDERRVELMGVLADAGYAVTPVCEPTSAFPLPPASALVLLVAGENIAAMTACYARLQRERPALPLVVLGPILARRDVAAGDYLALPYSPRDLLERVAVRLRGRGDIERALADRLVARGVTSVDVRALVADEMEGLMLGECLERLLERHTIHSGAAC